MTQFFSNMVDSGESAPGFFYPAAKEIGLSIEDVLIDGHKQRDLLVHIGESYPISAILRMTELWCEAASFGMECQFSDDDFPRLGAPAFPDMASLEDAVSPEPVNEVTRPLIDAVEQSVPRLSKPLIVGLTGPYTLSSVLCGSENFMMNCMMEPEKIEAFLEKITAFLIDYAKAYKNAGANGIILAEPSIAMISPDMSESFSNQYIERFLTEIQNDDFPVIYHNCGAVNAHLNSISKLSAQAFHFGNDVDLGLAIDALPADRAVMGNIDPRRFISGSEGSIEQEAVALLEKMSKSENFILSTGCDLSPSAQLSDIKRFVNIGGKKAS